MESTFRPYVGAQQSLSTRMRDADNWQDDDQPYRILFGANRVLAGCENHVNLGTTTIQFRDGGSTTAAPGNRRDCC